MSDDLDSLDEFDELDDSDDFDDLDNASFDSSSDDDDEKPIGVRQLVDNTAIRKERMPMLDVVYNRLVRSLVTSLRNLVGDNVEIHIESINTVLFGDYLDEVQERAHSSLFGVFKAEEWDNQGLINIDAPLVLSIVDLLLGGRHNGGVSAMPLDGRSFTVIERTLIEKMIEVVLNDLSIAFDPISQVTMRYERMETVAKFAPIARPNNSAVIASFKIEMEDREGIMEIVFPYATLEPVRELLLQLFMGEKFGRDSIWESHLTAELWQTDLQIDAILDELRYPLGEVLKWEVGTQIKLDKKVNDLIEIRSGNIPLFRAKLGAEKGYIAVQMQQRIEDTA